MNTEPFDQLTAEDYIASHGFGDATPEGIALAKELWAEGDDYATIGHEVVGRGMTVDLEDEDEDEQP